MIFLIFYSVFDIFLMSGERWTPEKKIKIPSKQQMRGKQNKNHRTLGGGGSHYANSHSSCGITMNFTEKEINTCAKAVPSGHISFLKQQYF